MNKTASHLAVLAASILIVGCNRPGENAQKSAPVPLEYNYAFDKKEVYVADASNDLAALDRKLDELSDQAAAAGGALKTNAQIKIQALRNQRAGLDQKLLTLKQATATNWDEAKSKFMKAYSEAKSSCQQAWQGLTENGAQDSRPLKP